MRCVACNAMMMVQYTRRGDLETLCTRCRSYIVDGYSSTRKDDTSLSAASQASLFLDIESQEHEEWEVLDRNTEWDIMQEAQGDPYGT